MRIANNFFRFQIAEFLISVEALMVFTFSFCQAVRVIVKKI
jgi:hypothetical protein